MMKKILIPLQKIMATPINTMPKIKNINVWSRQEKAQKIYHNKVKKRRVYLSLLEAQV